MPNLMASQFLPQLTTPSKVYSRYRLIVEFFTTQIINFQLEDHFFPTYLSALHKSIGCIKKKKKKKGYYNSFKLVKKTNIIYRDENNRRNMVNARTK